MMISDPNSANANQSSVGRSPATGPGAWGVAPSAIEAAGGYGPPGGGYPPGGGGGGYGGPPPGGGGGGYGGPPGGGGYGGPPGGGGYGGPPGGGGYGGPPGGGGYGGPPGGGYGGPPPGGFGGPPPQGFGPPGGFPPPGGPMMPGAGGDVNTTLPLILNIVGFFTCGWGCLSAILFIVGLVFSIQAGNMKKTGDVEGARAKAKTALTMAIVGYVLGVVGGIGFGLLRALQ